jgi:hypothetical protein
MTKVDLHFRLARPLEEEHFLRMAELPRVYGLYRVRPDAAGQNLLVEFDATRLSPWDVEAELARAGLPILPLQ